MIINPMEEFQVTGSATAFRKDPINYLTSAIPKGFTLAAQVSNHFAYLTYKILNIIFILPKFLSSNILEIHFRKTTIAFNL